MDILPNKSTFIQLAESSSRVPVCGQEKIPGLDLSKIFKELFLHTKNSFLFESAKGPEETARYSLMGGDCSKIIEITGRRACLYKGFELISEWDQPGPALDLLNFEKNVLPVDYLPHFWGGWVGFIGYEAGTWFESLPLRKKTENNLPDLLFMEVEQLFLYDHVTEIFKYILSPKTDSRSYDEIKSEIINVWNNINQVLQDIGNKTKFEHLLHPPLPSNGIKSNLNKKEYSERVEKAKSYIQEGDIYQANL
ncbi:MAG: hypothetical protein F3745_06955, partial [Nitrospinae bacterium]|nr:hypothetical protein [Nitrospinota bacterium]